MKRTDPEDWQEIPEEGDESDLPWSGSFSWIPFLDLNLNDPLLPPSFRLQQEKALRRARRLFFRLQRKKERRLQKKEQRRLRRKEKRKAFQENGQIMVLGC